jgi:gliding motility-associated-like protein
VLEVPFNADLNYHWKKDKIALPLETNEKLKVTEKGIYSLIISNRNICQKPIESDSIIVHVKNTKPEIKTYGSGVKVVWACEQDELIIKLKENPEKFDVEWTEITGPGDIIIGNGPEVKLTFGGHFKARFLNTGCAYEPFSKTVAAERYIGKPTFPIGGWTRDTSFAICPRRYSPSIPFEPYIDYPNFTLYHNDKPIKSEIPFIPSLTGKYFYVFGNPGCLDTTVTFNVTYLPDCIESKSGIIAPNIFTPNGDVINDTFEIFSLNEYQDYFNVTNFPNLEILIYDRWGKLVFHDKGYTEKFDGTYKGYSLPEGYYSFRLIYNDGFLKDKTGSFELRR